MRRSTFALVCTLVAGFASGAAAAPQDNAAVEHGVKVYAAQKCSVCHSIGGKGKASGPLDGVGSKLSADEIRQWLTHPKEMTEKTKSTRKPIMKDYSKLPKEDLDALVAYMSSLKKS
jgi:mono/diheme cytochrome c family protein